MAGKARITFFNPGLGMGGAERHTTDLRARLEARGYPTRLLVYGSGRSDNVLALPGAHDAEFLDCRGPSSLASWRRLGEALARDDSDLVFAVNHAPMISAAVFRRRLRGRVAGILHGTVPRKGEGLRTAVFWTAARALDAMIYVSDNQRAYWRARGLRAGEDRVIVNGIDLARFSPPDAGRRGAARLALGLGPSDYVVGILAAMRPEKNHLQLVEAHARLKRAGTAAKVIYLGDGPCRAEVERRVEALGLGADSLFVGEQADVRPFVHAFDVGVLCSVAIETLSLSGLEMMASAVPLVLSDIGGASELVAHGRSGYLFPVGDTDALVEGLARLADPGPRADFARAALERSRRFSVDQMVDSYVEVVEEMVARRPGRPGCRAR